MSRNERLVTDLAALDDGRCIASTWRGPKPAKPDYENHFGPGGFNRCVWRRDHDGDHKDEWGHVFIISPEFRVLRTEDPEGAVVIETKTCSSTFRAGPTQVVPCSLGDAHPGSHSGSGYSWNADIAVRCEAGLTGDNGMRVRCKQEAGHDGQHYYPGYNWGLRFSWGQPAQPAKAARASTVSMSITTPTDVRKAPEIRFDIDLDGIGYLSVEFSPEEFARLLAGGVLSDVEVEVQR